MIVQPGRPARKLVSTGVHTQNARHLFQEYAHHARTPFPKNYSGSFVRSVDGDQHVLIYLRVPLDVCGGPMTEFTIKILKANEPTYWYAGMEGKTFDVYRFGSSYVLAEDYDRGPEAIWRHIDEDDCEVV
jgi:hypothetical protein